LRYGGLSSLTRGRRVEVVVDPGVAEVGDDKASVACKEDIFDGYSTVDDTNFMDGENGNKLEVVQKVRFCDKVTVRDARVQQGSTWPANGLNVRPSLE